MGFIDTLADSERAVELADLTEHQQRVITLRWTYSFTQYETAAILGTSQPPIQRSEQIAIRKIQDVLAEWGIEPC